MDLGQLRHDGYTVAEQAVPPDCSTIPRPGRAAT
jgi:hypothetical protein